MREKIYEAMTDLMQNNCRCNYIIVQNGNETYIKSINALDAYMKAYDMSKDGNVECYIAALGKNNKAANPIFTVKDNVVTLSGIVIE